MQLEGKIMWKLRLQQLVKLINNAEYINVQMYMLTRLVVKPALATFCLLTEEDLRVHVCAF